MTALDNIDSESAFLLPKYIQKWRDLALLTQPINLAQAKTAVENAYAEIGKSKPSVLFFPSPFSALSVLIDLQLSGQFGQRLSILNDLYFEPYFEEMFKVHHLIKDRERIFNRYSFWESIRRDLNQVYNDQLRRKITTQFQGDTTAIQQHLNLLRRGLVPLNCYGNYCSGKIELWSGAVDFCIQVLGCGDSRQWQLIESLIQTCGWIFPLDKLALVCARPIKLSVDVEDQLHHDSEPALQYADGYSFYAFHGKIVDSEELRSLNDVENNRKKRFCFERSQLSEEQSSLLPYYLYKWKNVIFSTQPIDRDQARASLKIIYRELGKPEPIILFCSSPLKIFFTAATYSLQNNSFLNFWEDVSYQKYRSFNLTTLIYDLMDELTSGFFGAFDCVFEVLRPLNLSLRNLESILSQYIPWYSSLYWVELQDLWLRLKPPDDFLSYSQEVTESILNSKTSADLPQIFVQDGDYLQPHKFFRELLTLDFYINELANETVPELWLALISCFQNCGSVIAFRDICVVSERPVQILTDTQDLLHADNQAALVYIDGHCIFAQHGEFIWGR